LNDVARRVAPEDSTPNVELHSSSHTRPEGATIDRGTQGDTAMDRLARDLLGDEADGAELPTLGDLITAAVSLATGRRRKVLLPLGGKPAELALVRRGEDVLVSCYETGGAPEVLVLDRPTKLSALLEACADAAECENGSTESAEITRRLAERARHTQVCPDRRDARGSSRRGGAQEDPGEDVALAFGFAARIHPGPTSRSEASACADVHALLFEGELWAWIRGHRVALARGPIMLAVQRMVAAVSALVDAWDAGRPVNVRLNTGTFRVGVRLGPGDRAAITLGESRDTVTVTALDVAGLSLPVLRLASDVLRALVSADRSQARNLRVRSMRSEVRALRRRIRARSRDDGFVNRDPDRLRLDAPREASDASAPATRPMETGRLRFAERWRLDLDELDATTTFLCGDRIVIATPRRALAVARDDGEVLWVREGAGGASMMAGQVLLRQSPEGALELCDVGDGEPYAVTHVRPRIGGPTFGLLAGGGSLPPVAVLSEGENRLVAIDLRNGEPRWRFTARGAGAFKLRRVGRVLLVVSGEGSVDALDVASGEVVWRYTDGVRFSLPPVVCRDIVVAASGDTSGRRGALHGLDLYSGERLWRRDVDTAPTSAPIAAGRFAAVALRGRRRDSLACFEPTDGSLRWMVPDPGMGVGGAHIAFDQAIVINAPAGCVTSLGLEDGHTRWSCHVSDPLADDVPRRLEPVLRGGALFVPAASVHVLRPTDGSPIGSALPCELVPDLIRVDERGWVYVAEESGSISALAPVPHLSLVRGGS